jgi:hypothetical protein
MGPLRDGNAKAKGLVAVSVVVKNREIRLLLEVEAVPYYNINDGGIWLIGGRNGLIGGGGDQQSVVTDAVNPAVGLTLTPWGVAAGWC